MIRMYRYSEGEKSFIMIDGRDVEIPRFRKSETVHSLCLIHDVDGIAILDKSCKADFSLEFFGADVVPACFREDAVAFADLVGIKAFHSKEYTFEFSGAVHNAIISSHLGECKEITLSESGYHASAICEGELE